MVWPSPGEASMFGPLGGIYGLAPGEASCTGPPCGGVMYGPPPRGGIIVRPPGEGFMDWLLGRSHHTRCTQCRDADNAPDVLTSPSR